MLYFDTNLLEKDIAQKRFIDVRSKTEELANSISPEDAQIQSMPDVSPTKFRPHQLVLGDIPTHSIYKKLLSI